MELSGSRKIHLVYKENMRVLDDYIQSLGIFDTILEITRDFSVDDFLASDDIFVFTQMWLHIDTFSESVWSSPRFIFLNVENLTEQLRWNHVLAFLERNVRVADYSPANIHIIQTFLNDSHIQYTHTPILLPYQFNHIENLVLKNQDNIYEYDVGIVNACPKKDSSVSSHLTYKRTLIWEKMKAHNWNCVNILGWGKERDELIRKCKVIVNVHHFECFSIFQHIRCDRLIFANKLIVSENSLCGNDLDMKNLVVWSDFSELLETTHKVLNDFDRMNSVLSSIDKNPLIQKRQNDLLEACRLIQNI
jgi:hypothetical protein